MPSKQLLVALAILSRNFAKASQENEKYCLGYSKVSGAEGKQVTDDALHAV